LIHVAIRTAGMGRLFPIYAVPVLAIALVAGALVGRRGSAGFRRASMVATILLACGVFTLLRTDGITGETGSQFAWRWTKTSEERLLAQGRNQPALTPPPTLADVPRESTTTNAGAGPATFSSTQLATNKDSEWPGFRGPNRDGVVHGVRIKTDWAASPPIQQWRRPIGPGWSSFAVQGDLLYTQEQRGEDEIVACYKLMTGEPVWQHRDPV